jgi:ubiquitin-protein ligase
MSDSKTSTAQIHSSSTTPVAAEDDAYGDIIPRQIRLIRQRSKDWVEKHAVCGLTDQKLTSRNGYILTQCDQAYFIPALKEALRKALKNKKIRSWQLLVGDEDAGATVSPVDLNFLLEDHEYYNFLARAIKHRLKQISKLTVADGKKKKSSTPQHAGVVGALAKRVKQAVTTLHSDTTATATATATTTTPQLTVEQHAEKLTEWLVSQLVYKNSKGEAISSVSGGMVPKSSMDFEDVERFLFINYILQALDRAYQKVSGRKITIHEEAAAKMTREADTKSGDDDSSVEEVTDDLKRMDIASKKVNKAGVGYTGSAGDSVAQQIENKGQERLKIDYTVAILLEMLRGALTDPQLKFACSLDIYGRLYHSSVNPLLAVYLRNTSLEDIGKRHAVYRPVFALVNVLGVNPNTLPLLRPDNSRMHDSLGDHVSLLALMRQVNGAAKLFLGSDEASNADMDSEALALLGLVAEIKAAGDMLDAHAKIFRNTFKKVRLYGADKDDNDKANGDAAGADGADVDDSKVDMKELSSYLLGARFAMMDLLDGPVKHIFETDAKSSTGVANKMRLRKEIASLSSSLPENIFVRVDNTRFDVMRFCIVGPWDTPYEQGLFFFDMFLPATYPQVPPKVKITTTGHGSFRFNPNLYANGKVCLSLLGTWSGPGWDPKVSTLLQVLVSIQAMVMTDEPYYNEPGWANDKGTPRENRAHIYHAQVRHAATMYAMSDYINKPLYGFEDVTRVHFYVNRNKIYKQLEHWDELRKKAQEGGDVATTSVYGQSVIKPPKPTWEKAVEDVLEKLKAMEPPTLELDSDDEDF